MRFKLLGNKKFYESKHWEKRGEHYVRTKKHTQDDVLRFKAHIKNIKEAPDADPDDRDMTIFGIANANVVDRMDERLDPVGLDLKDFMRNPVLLAYHNHNRPVGNVVELDIQEDGIYFVAKIGDPKKGSLTTDQKEIRSLVAQGVLKAVSVGFIPKRIKGPVYSDDGELQSEMVIEQWEMLELSIVSVPANQESLFDLKDCKDSSKSVIVDPSTPKKLNNQSRDLNMLLKKLKALKALLLKSASLVDAEIIEADGNAKLTFVIDDVKSAEDLLGKIKGEDDAEDSKEGMPEALTLLRSISSDLKTNTEMTESIRGLMDKPKEDEEEDPKDDEEDKKPEDDKEDEDKKDESSDDEKDFDARLKALEDSSKEFQDDVKGQLDTVVKALEILAADSVKEDS